MIELDPRQKNNENLTEIIEEYRDGKIVSCKINGKEVKISKLQKEFVCLNKMSFEKVKSIYGYYGN